MNGELKQVLASVDTLREAWEVSLGQASTGEFAEARRRSLRRHAIETGLIERLYDFGQGITEALVAEGLTAEVAEREGGLDDDALTIIRSQYDALDFLAEAARNGTDLNVHFVRELHQALCRTQSTYEARNDSGQTLRVPLHHGTWKTQPNYARRHDGTLLEYTPPAEPAAEGTGALAVARAYAHRLHTLRHAKLTERATQAEILAGELQKKLVVHLEQLGAGIRDQFREADPKTYSSVNHGEPSSETAKYWQIQMVRTAREVNMFTNLSKGSWWTRLHLVVLDQTLRFVVVIQRVGPGETGVLAVTVFAEALAPRASEDDERPLPTPLFESTPADSVTLVFSDDPDARGREVCELIDNTLAAALDKFAQQLG
ncbi:MAG: hypothetical protein ACRDR6_04395 [Pseudonocardiaceae bacterium]